MLKASNRPWRGVSAESVMVGRGMLSHQMRFGDHAIFFRDEFSRAFG
jgi:hypothetical protein